MVLPEPYFSLSDSRDTSCAIRFFSEPVPQLRDSWDKHMVLPQTEMILSCSYHVINHKFTRAGFEPATSGLTCRRSTNWANELYIGGLPIFFVHPKFILLCSSYISWVVGSVIIIGPPRVQARF